MQKMGFLHFADDSIWFAVKKFKGSKPQMILEVFSL